MSREILPNFLIVGAAKSGTTSLYHYLKQHPQICLSEIKEPQFFVRERVKKSLPQAVCSEDQYFALFKGSEGFPARGEASVFYLYFWETAIPNIKHYLGDQVKIIIILRNPVERAFSAYSHVYRHNPVENLDFANALACEDERKANPSISPMTHYKSMGLYSGMVEAYLHNFHHVLIVLHDELRIAPNETMIKIQEYLEVDIFKFDLEKKHNVGGVTWNSNFYKYLIKNIFDIQTKRKLKNKFPKTYKIFKDKFYNISTKKPEDMNEIDRNYLKTFYKEDIIKLEKIINMDLESWVI